MIYPSLLQLHTGVCLYLLYVFVDIGKSILRGFVFVRLVLSVWLLWSKVMYSENDAYLF